MTELDVRPSGWDHLRQPETTPATPEPPPVDLRAARRGLAAARAALAGWTLSDHPVGTCAVAGCGLPCRSTDPTGIVRHIQCEGPA